MKNKTLYALWGGMFVLCAGLGFIPEPAGFLTFLLTVLALAFFIPPALLLYRAAKTADRHTASLVRNLALAWLAVTTVLLAANFLSLRGTTGLGDMLHALLVVASAPMICGQSWVLIMFCWACLLFTGNHILKTTKTRT